MNLNLNNKIHNRKQSKSFSWLNVGMVLALFCLSFTTAAYSQEWRLGTWYSTPMTIPAAKVGADLTNFPVLVKLQGENFDFDNSTTNGVDVRFTADALGDTLLDFERAVFDPVSRPVPVNFVINTNSPLATKDDFESLIPLFTTTAGAVLYEVDTVNKYSEDGCGRFRSMGISEPSIGEIAFLNVDLSDHDTLSFYFQGEKLRDVGYPSVVIDNTEIWSSNKTKGTDTDVAWQKVNLDISSYSGTHDVKFRMTVGVTSYTNRIFRFDNVELRNSGSVSGVGEFWVRLPLVSASSDTTFYMWQSAQVVDDASNPTNVWGADFMGVWHKQGGSGTTIADSTANGRNGAKKAAGKPAESLGVAGFAQLYNSANPDYVKINNFAMPDDFTTTIWLRKTSQRADRYDYFFSQGSDLEARHNFNIYFNSQSGFRFRFNSATDHDISGKFYDGRWHQITLSNDGTGNMVIYVDGVAKKSANSGGNYKPTADIYLGIRGDNARFYDGWLDELRISSTIRSATWIKAEFDNMTKNDTFVARGLTSEVIFLADIKITNGDAVDIGHTSAGLAAVLEAEAGEADVTCYWGKTNGGVEASNWTHSYAMGTKEEGTFTNVVSSLEPATRYYFRFYATNNDGSAWAPASSSFFTTGAPAVENASASNITDHSAVLNGTLIKGVPTPHVFIYWGESDGEDDAEAWGNVIDCGLISPGNFSKPVSGILANKTYWYRVCATNEHGIAWADDSESFVTSLPVLTPAAARVDEGAAGTTNKLVFNLTLSNSSGADVTVNFATANSSATIADNDYVATNGAALIPAGSPGTQIEVEVIGDNRMEANETLNLNLSSVSGATLAASQVAGTIVNDDLVAYVRGDGQGSDSNDGSSWANAFATIQKAFSAIPNAPVSRVNIPISTNAIIYVQSSENGQRYDVAERTGSNALDFEIHGGWQNVDTQPAQTGLSVVEDLDGTVDEAGFTINNGGYLHGNWRRVQVSNFSFNNVRDGILFPHSGDYADIFLTVSNCTIRAQKDGIYINYPKGFNKSGYGGYGQLKAYNVDIVGGLGGTGNALYTDAFWGDSVVTAVGDDPATGKPRFSSLSAPNGTGIYFRANNYPDKPRIYLDRTIIHGCAGPAIRLGADRLSDYGPPKTVSNIVEAVITHCTIVDNGGDGLVMIGNQAGSFAAITNTIFAANGGTDVNLTESGFTCDEAYNMFSSENDIVVNGVVQTPDANSSTDDPLFVANGEKPVPWFGLNGRASPAWNSATDGTNRGAIQGSFAPLGTVIIFR